jgi:hypothetical protein
LPSNVTSSAEPGAVVSFAPPEVVDQHALLLNALPLAQPASPPRQYFAAASAAPDDVATSAPASTASPSLANTPPADLPSRVRRCKIVASRNRIGGNRTNL